MKKKIRRSANRCIRRASKHLSTRAHYEQLEKRNLLAGLPPTIDPLPDLAVDEDAGAQEVNLTGIGAGGLEAQAIRVTATSSNTALIPDPTIVYNTPSAFGWLYFTSNPNLPLAATQSSLITVKVRDWGNDQTFDTFDDEEIEETFTVTVNPINDTPTLDQPADLTIAEDSGTQSLTLTGITAGGGESQPLRVNVSSSNTTLIPTPALQYSSPNSTGIITFAPVADNSGQSEITITVEDGGLDGNLASSDDNVLLRRTFLLTVTPVNDDPTLNPISDLFIDEDSGSHTVNLSGITAGGGESQSLRVTAVSNNPTLIANPGVSYASPGQTGFLNLAPLLNQNGVATITVTVEDAGFDGNFATSADNRFFSRNFLVTVNPVNDTPTLDPLSNLTINEDAPLQTVNLFGITAGPNESQLLRVFAASSNPGLIPTPNANYTSANLFGSITFQPVANQSGTATITVTVEDAGNDGDFTSTFDNLTFSRTFNVTVLPLNDQPTLDPLGNLTVDNGKSQTVALSGITAGGGESQPLRVTAVSSNPLLVPNPAVTYTSPDQTGSLVFTALANQSGTALITVRVEDGGLDGDLNTPADNAVFSRSFEVAVSPVNDSPTLNPIGDLTINENAGQQTVNLSGITAGGGESQPLRISASSGNTSLIPNPTVFYVSPNQTGSLTFTPVINQSGSAIVTVTVEDGGLDLNLTTSADNGFFSRSFLVTVNPGNKLPTLDPIGDLIIDEDSPLQSINLTGITAGPGETQPLRVTALSNNLGLIPNPTVIYSSPSQTGLLSFTPVSNTSGVATITVTVEDGGLDKNLATPADNAVVSRTFQVTVAAVNDAPTLDPLSDLTIDEDSPSRTVNLSGITAGGNETQNLRVVATSSNSTLIANPSVSYISPSQTGTISFQPLPNQFGVTTITVTVEDAGLDGNFSTAGDNLTFSRSFQVTVNPVNEAPTLEPISDLTIDEDALETFVDLLGISAGGVRSQPLRVSAVSNNTALIPNPQVNYTSPNPIGSLGIKPVANRFGSALITVSVEDGGLDGDLNTSADNATVSRSFTVIVNPVNDAPTLFALADLVLNEDAGPQLINLSGISAGGGESQPLRVTASSSNTTLVPNLEVFYLSADQTGAIRFTPSADRWGQAVISVLVEDGGLDGLLSTTIDNATFSRSFLLTVNPVNEPPTLNFLGNLTLLEDAAERTVNLTGISAGGIKAQPLRVTAVSDNTGLIPNPQVNYQSANSNGFIRFTPLANQFGVANLTVTVEDGGLDQDLNTAADNATTSRVFSVTVQSVNDSPMINNFGADVTFTENGAPVKVAPTAVVFDADTNNFSGGRLTATLVGGGQPDDQLVLLPTGFLNIVGNYLVFAGKTVGTWAGGTGGVPLTITFSGEALTNRVQHTLQNIAFRNSSDAPGSTPRQVVVELTDGAGGSTADTFEPSKQIRVIETNDAPQLSNLGGPVTYLEGSTPVRIADGLVVNDPDSANFGDGLATVRISSGAEPNDRLVILGTNLLTVTDSQVLHGGLLVANYSGGSGAQPLTIEFNSAATRTIVQQILQNVAFRSLAEEPASATRLVQFELNDGDGGVSSPVGKQLQVLAVNDIPVIGNLGLGVNYVEKAAPVRIAATATVTDVDSPNFGGGFLQVSFQSGYQTGDQLEVLASDGISIVGGSIVVQGTSVGTFTGGKGGAALVIGFNDAATASIVQAVLRNVAFRHLTNAPSTQMRMLGLLLDDGDGGSYGVVIKPVNVIPVNDAPIIGGIGGVQSYVMDSSPVFLAGNATLSDADQSHFGGGKLIVRITAGANVGNRLLIGGGFSVDSSNGVWFQGVRIGNRNPGGGVDYTNLEIVFNGNATTAVVQQLMRSIQFQTVKGRGWVNRNVEFLVLDGAGGVSNVLAKQVAVTRK